MTPPLTAPELERALQRYGDDLYRLALLLCRDEPAAARVLPLVARRMADTPSADEPALIRALIAALPAKPANRPPRRLPAWAKPPAARSELGALLAAIAALPRSARQVLGLSTLRAFEPEQVAAIAGGDAASVRAQLRDAMLALAPHAPIERAPALLSPDDAPDECRPTRAALALADPRDLANPAVRGHLALCSACRAADLAWSQLATAVEEALRGALRDVRLPPALAERVLAAARTPDADDARWYSQPRARIALVALPVLLAIAFLVWPRAAPPGAAPSGAASPPDVAPAELVRRAREQLYASPGDTGVWHAQYAIEWAFADGTHALLHADEWLEPEHGRHRLQLVHHTGGGPYEFELAGDRQVVWYALSPGYAPSLYPFGIDAARLRARYSLGADQRDQMLQARLQSGAWSLPAAYLRQAAGAELHTWGRQRDADGRFVRLISFPGVSPLALPADAPEAAASNVTVLLAIDEASGRLREVRELFGEAGTEQSARTTWKVLFEETIADAEQANRVFDQRTAWNGTGSFVERERLLSPQLPLFDPPSFVSPAWLLRVGLEDPPLPAHAPPQTNAAALIDRNSQASLSRGYSPGELTFAYFGEGRRLFVNSAEPGQQLFTLARPERLALGGNAVFLQPLAVQGYRALILRPSDDQAVRLTVQVAATGYTRAELLALIQSLGPITPAALREQAPLFIEPRPHDAAWQALIGALADAPQPPPGGARHFVEHVFKRQLRQPDPLADPYHRPPYAGWPEQLVQENWLRDDSDGTRTSGALTRDSAGRLLARQYRGPRALWDYDAVAGRATWYQLARSTLGLPLNEDQNTVLRVLACPGVALGDEPGGRRSVTVAETEWRERSCAQPQYVGLLRQQEVAGFRTDAAPFLADLDADTLTTVIVLGADGRPTSTAVWAGPSGSGTLLESWERVSEEELTAAQVPAEIFSAEPPPALTQIRYSSVDLGAAQRSAGLYSATLTETLKLARSPLFGFAAGQGQPVLVSLNVGPPPGQATSAYAFDESSGLFDRMLAEGYATRSVYSASTSAGFQLLRFYQGAASEAAAFLRAQAAWSSSERQQITVGGRAIAAWEVTERDTNGTWLIFELEGTLIAVQSPGAELLPVIERLVQLGPGAP